MPNRIPVITIWFWLAKTLITGADIAWPDYLYGRLGLVTTTGLIATVLAVTLVAQFRTRSYRAWAFWPAMAAISVTGTEAANGPHAQLGVPYWAVAVLYLGVLAAVLTWWRAGEATLSLRSIDTGRREGFFWAAALTGFALGTAVGHATATIAGLSVWIAVTAGIALAWRRLPSSAIPAFWTCFAVTRPLGTWIAIPLASRVGIVAASTLLGLTVIGIVAYLTTSGHDILEPDRALRFAPGEDGHQPTLSPEPATGETPKPRTL